MKLQWRTAWQGQEIVVFREDEEVDRFDAAQIQRVIFVHRDSGDSPGDLVLAVVELADDHLLLPADTGFAGRVNFERQAYWTERACVYWVNEAQASLPLRLRRSRWFLGFAGPSYVRLPRTELTALVERWPLQGPQTWEARKWRRIERNRPFAPADPTELQA